MRHHKRLLLRQHGADVQFGSNFSKEPVYVAVLTALNSSLASGGSLKGVLFWRWSEDGGSDQTTVKTGDSIFQCVQPLWLYEEHLNTTHLLLSATCWVTECYPTIQHSSK